MQHPELQKLITQFTTTHHWPLAEDDVTALAAAVAPFVAQEDEPSAATVTRIIVNYYHDGPMVAAMQANSREGEALWSEWRAYMVSLANNKGLYGDTAEELAQDAYLQTVRALETFRFGSRLKTYFCGIFLNCYRHWARSRKSQGAREEELTPLTSDETTEEQAPWLIDSAPSPEETVVEAVHGGQIARLVQEEITKITKHPDFQILRWYYVEQRFVDDDGNEQKWTDEQIGRQLDMPLNTVTSRRLRAVRRLKQHPRLQELFAQLVD